MADPTNRAKVILPSQVDEPLLKALEMEAYEDSLRRITEEARIAPRPMNRHERRRAKARSKP